MKLISSNTCVSNTQVKKAPSLKDRTFTLSPEAFAIIQHSAAAYGQSLSDTLEAFITVLDTMMLDGSLHNITVQQTSNGITYSTVLHRTSPILEASSAQLKAIS